jgi:hypothetical protein
LSVTFSHFLSSSATRQTGCNCHLVWKEQVNCTAHGSLYPLSFYLAEKMPLCYTSVENAVSLNAGVSCSMFPCKSIRSKAVSLSRHHVIEAYRGRGLSSTY